MAKATFRFGIAAVCVSLLGVMTLVPAEAGGRPDVLNIGIMDTLFQDMTEPAKKGVLVDLKSLTEEETGFRAKTEMFSDPMKLAGEMEGKKTHMAIMLGYEFAWAQQKYPDLKPLAVAVSNRKNPQALLIVRSDSKVAGLAGLKGRSLALPKKTPGHVRLFLEREGRKNGAPLKTQDYPDIESALDDVVRGKLDAVAIEAGSLDNYRLVKPGAAKRLKVLHESPLFPAGVVAYREGVLDSDTLKGFRKGLLNAGKNQRSRTLMGLWNIEAFEAVPKDFLQTAENIRKIYPPPSAKGKDVPQE